MDFWENTADDALCIIKTIFNFVLSWSLFSSVDHWASILVCVSFAISKKEIELTSVWPRTATMRLWRTVLSTVPTAQCAVSDMAKLFERNVFVRRKLKENFVEWPPTWNVVSCIVRHWRSPLQQNWIMKLWLQMFCWVSIFAKTFRCVANEMLSFEIQHLHYSCTEFSSLGLIWIAGYEANFILKYFSQTFVRMWHCGIIIIQKLFSI